MQIIIDKNGKVIKEGDKVGFFIGEGIADPFRYWEVGTIKIIDGIFMIVDGEGEAYAEWTAHGKELEILESKISKWDLRFLGIAEAVSEWSKDTTKVGAVLISPDRTQISYGYNGFARGIADDERLSAENKNLFMVHAEINAIFNAKIDLKDWTLYATKFPCIECAKAIIQSHLKRIVVKARFESKWIDSQNLAYNLLKEANIIVEEV